MKKYLMMGAAALTMGFAFVSCSSDDDIYNPNAAQNQIVANYQKAFIKTFGQPAANHTWGFGAASRATRGHDADANEWANRAEGDNTGSGGWLVPDALTEGQKLRVKAFFQANPNLGFEDPHFTNYFIQQVYTGGTAPGENSPEVYYAADDVNHSKPLKASNSMDELYTFANGNKDRINNFNSGGYVDKNNGNATINNNVLNNGSYIFGNQVSYHADQIMLMINSGTEKFEYNNTACSKRVDNKMALVSAATIDTWADANGYIGEPVTDQWNRSFMGFDFDMYSLDEATYKENGNAKAFKPSDYNVTCEYYTLDGTTFNKVSSNQWENFKYNGKDVNYLISNANFYCGEYVTLNDADLAFNVNMDNGEYNTNGIGQYLGKCLNMKTINDLLSRGFQPVYNSALKTWVKFAPACDGYYSDWIVTLTNAERTEKPSLRVMAEDLSATDGTDFDFNDIVFDVNYISNSEVKIVLRAAGGTLPLRIAENDEWETHKLFDVNQSVMVNTNAKAKGLSGAWKDPVELTLTGTFSSNENEFAAQVKGIKIEVYKNDKWVEMDAQVGKPACKFGIPRYLQWAQERSNVNGCFNFAAWVQDPSIRLTSTVYSE